MSWSGDSDNNTKFSMAEVNKWQAQLKITDQTLNQIKQLIDSTNRDFEILKHKHGEVKTLENAREKLNTLFRQLERDISNLENQLLSANNQNLNHQKIKIKELRSRAAACTKNFRDLCTNINAELKSREMQRKKEISIISNEFDYDYENKQHFDQMTMNDSQIKELEEELKQSEKINKDVILLEDMFIRLNSMIEEQGEVVNNISTNVESAYDHVDQANTQLDKAVEYKKSAFKKKLCIIGIVIAVLAALALIIGLAVGLKSRNS